MHEDKEEPVNSVLPDLARAIISRLSHSGSALSSLPVTARECATICRGLSYARGDARTKVRRTEQVREGFRVLEIIGGFTLTELPQNRMMLDIPPNTTRVPFVANVVDKMGMTESEGAGLAGWSKERFGMMEPTDSVV